jgi:hypothetical protein
MKSFNWSNLVVLTALVAIAQTAYAQQPPDVDVGAAAKKVPEALDQLCRC